MQKESNGLTMTQANELERRQLGNQYIMASKVTWQEAHVSKLNVALVNNKQRDQKDTRSVSYEQKCASDT